MFARTPLLPLYFSTTLPNALLLCSAGGRPQQRPRGRDGLSPYATNAPHQTTSESGTLFDFFNPSRTAADADFGLQKGDHHDVPRIIAKLQSKVQA